MTSIAEGLRRKCYLVDMKLEEPYEQVIISF